MPESELIIDVEELYQDTILIINYPTGVKYTAQVGGIGCYHPEAEGLALSLGEYAAKIDDCSFGCEYIQRMPEEQKKLADHLDSFFILNHPPFPAFKFRFDYQRLNELMEGWWPVLVTGFYGDKTKFENAPGYINTGNCD